MIIGFLIAAVGIMTWSGVLHTAIGLRDSRDPVNLTFGVTALCFAMFTLSAVVLARATTVDQAELWISIKVTFALLSWMGVIAFAWAFLKSGRAWPWLMGLVGAVLLAHLLLPGGVYLEEVQGIRTDHLPWGESIQRIVYTQRVLVLPMLVAITVSLAYAIRRSVIAYRTRLGRRPVVFLIGLAILTLALLDDLVRMTALTYAVDEIAMLAFTILMGTYLVEDAADTAQARSSARLSSNRLQALLDTAPEAILLYDRESGTFVDANRRALELFGMDLTGRDWFQFSTRSIPVQPDGFSSVDRADAALREARTKEARPTEWSVVDAGGTVIPCELRIAPLSQEKDTLVRVSLIDLRPLREADHRRRLAEEQLRHAQRLEALGQMTSRIAHDLSNILTPIMARADLALGRFGQDDPELREDLEEIVRASERARELASQVLRYSRRSRGTGSAADVSNVVRSLMSLFRTAAPAGVVVQAVIKETCVARISRQHAEQVISNLAVNAIHACGKSGHVRITVGCTRVAGEIAERHPDFEEPGAVRVTVQDDGVGIPEQLLERVMEPYYTTKGDEGTGLGLSIVSDLVREVGGSVRVDSTPSVGTIFEILLPMAGQADPRPDIRPAPSPAWSGRVLVVEDDRATCLAVGQLLEALGFEVQSASSVTEARHALRDPDWRLLVTDVELPDGTGVEIAAWARERPEPIPVLFITGSGGDLGDDPVGPALPKPFSLHELAEAVAGLIPQDLLVAAPG
ncbi:MAG TPA: ATP-binding protein [Longimicrobiales bacterium]|nr:ATP-binding protein [Longimicrobiales bacterium]